MNFCKITRFKESVAVLFFIWAARLPTVAVGLSALLRFARARSYPCRGTAEGRRNRSHITDNNYSILIHFIGIIPH